MYLYIIYTIYKYVELNPQLATNNNVWRTTKYLYTFTGGTFKQ